MLYSCCLPVLFYQVLNNIGFCEYGTKRSGISERTSYQINLQHREENSCLMFGENSAPYCKCAALCGRLPNILLRRLGTLRMTPPIFSFYFMRCRGSFCHHCFVQGSILMTISFYKDESCHSIFKAGSRSQRKREGTSLRFLV